MGLFDAFKKKKAAAPEPSRDAGPAPREVLEYRQKRCVEVDGGRYFQPARRMLGEGAHDVIIRRPGPKEWGDYAVRTVDNVTLGVLYADRFERLGVEPRGTIRAEVVAPRYANETEWMLFIPIPD